MKDVIQMFIERYEHGVWASDCLQGTDKNKKQREERAIKRRIMEGKLEVLHDIIQEIERRESTEVEVEEINK